MARVINGVDYVSLGELADEVGVARQTLWRWRNEGRVPSGHRFRNRTILFTAEEVEAIRAYAFRLEPATGTSRVHAGRALQVPREGIDGYPA